MGGGGRRWARGGGGRRGRRIGGYPGVAWGEEEYNIEG